VNPLKLVNFEPVDGPDNRYRQLHRPIKKSSFEAAGLKGFTPLTVFKANDYYVLVHTAFHWPACQELDAGMAAKQATIMANMWYNGPPQAPLEPAHIAPCVSSIGMLAMSIIKSADRMFLVADDANPNFLEWRLVHVTLEDSMSLHPSCLQDGHFLVNFVIAHTDGVQFKRINKKFWLQYHSKGGTTSQSKTYLIRPSTTSEDYARKEILVPFRKWMYLTHASTYIH
jgi:hypothetical protein